MRKLALIFMIFIFLVLPTLAHAQNPISFSSMFIQIWPEYDKPSVLVIYQITLAPSTTYPAQVSILIPTAAGEPNAVAEKQPDGSLYTITYTRSVNGDWASINFTTTSSVVQLEYYDPGLTTEGAARHFEYLWPGGYAISQLTIQVQQPAGTTDMTISPSLGAGAVGTDNLTYYTQDIGAISADQTIKITIDYQKASSALSAESVPVAPSSPIPQSTLADLNIFNWLPWILGIIGAGLIIGGVVWFWRTGRQRPSKQPRRRHARTEAITPATEQATDEAAVYCSQCGKRASPGDQFCRSCGTPIRLH
jgi:hypothetical protein